MIFHFYWLVQWLLARLQTSRDTFDRLVEKPFIEKGHAVSILVAHGGYYSVKCRDIMAIRPSLFIHLKQISRVKKAEQNWFK